MDNDTDDEDIAALRDKRNTLYLVLRRDKRTLVSHHAGIISVALDMVWHLISGTPSLELANHVVIAYGLAYVIRTVIFNIIDE